MDAEEQLGIFWHNTALAELDDILADAKERRGLDAAVNLLNDINNTVAWLASYPDYGRSGRIEGTRELVVRKSGHVIGYAHLPDARIVRLHIGHGRQQWPDKMPEL